MLLPSYELDIYFEKLLVKDTIIIPIFQLIDKSTEDICIISESIIQPEVRLKNHNLNFKKKRIIEECQNLREDIKSINKQRMDNMDDLPLINYFISGSLIDVSYKEKKQLEQIKEQILDSKQKKSHIMIRKIARSSEKFKKEIELKSIKLQRNREKRKKEMCQDKKEDELDEEENIKQRKLQVI